MMELQYPELFKKLKVIEKELINFRIYDLKIYENDFYEHGYITLTFRHDTLEFKNSMTSFDIFMNDITENEITYEIITIVAHSKLLKNNYR